jgi:hypothetical protein
MKRNQGQHVARTAILTLREALIQAKNAERSALQAAKASQDLAHATTLSARNIGKVPHIRPDEISQARKLARRGNYRVGVVSCHASEVTKAVKDLEQLKATLPQILTNGSFELVMQISKEALYLSIRAQHLARKSRQHMWIIRDINLESSKLRQYVDVVGRMP